MRIACGLSAIALSLFCARQANAQPAIPGYLDYDAYGARVQELSKSKLAKVESLGKTLGGREVYLVTLGLGKSEEKPAILIVGNVEAPHLVGSEMALRMAEAWADHADEASVRQLFEQYTIYVIPRPTPDASEAFFHPPYAERTGNARPTDDDRDGDLDEDPVEDLNKDGWITMLRVEDETGSLLPHPLDERVLIDADRSKNERGRFKLYTEGRDTDGDESFNEDGPGGVAFNRNFTFRYPYYAAGAGPRQVSEIETRAVADFAFDHPNIALVLTFTPEDNLVEPAAPWKPDSKAEEKKIKTTLLSADADYFNYLAGEYRSLLDAKDPPPSPTGEGSFSEWAYFHYGRWSLSVRAWWIPKTPPLGAPAPAKSEGNGGDKRGADDINALVWFGREGIDGFTTWTAIEHADFPGRKVEVGGFKPFFRLNPPAKELDALAAKHAKFVHRLVELMPRIKIQSTKLDSLGGGVFRVTTAAINTGYLPTMPAMGKLVGDLHPLQIKIDLPEGAKLLTGSMRSQLEPLAGGTGRSEHSWTIAAEQAKANKATITVWSPSVGSDTTTVELKNGTAK